MSELVSKLVSQSDACVSVTLRCFRAGLCNVHGVFVCFSAGLCYVHGVFVCFTAGLCYVHGVFVCFSAGLRGVHGVFYPRMHQSHLPSHSAGV